MSQPTAVPSPLHLTSQQTTRQHTTSHHHHHTTENTTSHHQTERLKDGAQKNGVWAAQLLVAWSAHCGKRLTSAFVFACIFLKVFDFLIRLARSFHLTCFNRRYNASTRCQGWSDGAFCLRAACSRVSFGCHALLPPAGVCESRIRHLRRAAGTVIDVSWEQILIHLETCSSIPYFSLFRGK